MAIRNLMTTVIKSRPLHKDERPSIVASVYWLFSFSGADYPNPTSRSGKWLLFVPLMEIDRHWAVIKEATEIGKLGGMSKVATAKLNNHASDSDTKVICIYTYDWMDKKDAMKIREELRELGYVDKIPYKADVDTRQNKYAVLGDKKISKYYI